MKFTYLTAFIVAGAALTLTSCGENKKTSDLTESGLDPDNFVTTVNGKTTGLYTLKIIPAWKSASPISEDASSR